MPCYLFTFHAYRSWMPDRARGYVRRRLGVLPQDLQMAEVYRKHSNHEMVRLLADHQRAAINTLQEAATHIDCQLHFVATDATHIHTLVSWNGERTWKQNRVSLKRALSLAFKQKFGERPWLSDGASRKRVRDDTHFNYLVARYLPSHKGWKWDQRLGPFQ